MVIDYIMEIKQSSRIWVRFIIFGTYTITGNKYIYS